MLPVVAVQLYHLGKVSLSGENVLYPFPVKVESIRRELQAMFGSHAVVERGEESVGRFSIPFADRVSGNQFCISVNSNEHPSISNFRRILCFYVALLLETKRPDFVRLNPLAFQILHFGFHQLYAAFTSENEQTHDGVSVQLRDALGAANTGAFDEKLNRQKRLIFRHIHRVKQSGVFFGKSLFALIATKALQTVSVLPELAAFRVTDQAIHANNIQRAVAVCQWDNARLVLC